jgi:hypothetical protein
MSKQLHEIAPVEYTYTVENLYDYEKRVISFDSLGAAREYILSHVKTDWRHGWERTPSIYELVSDSPIRYRNAWHSDSLMCRLEKKYKWSPVPRNLKFTEGSYPFLVKNQHGAIISAGEVASAPKYVHQYTYRNRSRNNANYDAIAEARLTNRKNAAKIKWLHMTHTVITDSRLGYGEEEVEEVYWWWYRSPKTSQEIRVTHGHDTEFHEDYGFKKFGRARRGYRHMPKWFDDKPIAAKRMSASWKTNSKRKKQWKGE